MRGFVVFEDVVRAHAEGRGRGLFQRVAGQPVVQAGQAVTGVDDADGGEGGAVEGAGRGIRVAGVVDQRGFDAFGRRHGEDRGYDPRRHAGEHVVERG